MIVPSLTIVWVLLILIMMSLEITGMMEVIFYSGRSFQFGRSFHLDDEQFRQRRPTRFHLGNNESAR